MNDDLHPETTWSFKFYFPVKVECPLCYQNVYPESIISFRGENSQEIIDGVKKSDLWRGCVTCLAQIPTDHPKILQRLAVLEQKFEELNSKIRKYE